MAYFGQEKKKTIHAALKSIIPTSWKWTTGVRHHSTFVLNIWSAPVDLIALVGGKGCQHDLNPYWYRTAFEKAETPQEIRDIFEKVFEAINVGNHDRSDLQSDYHDVGWYVDVNFGKYDKPFVVVK